MAAEVGVKNSFYGYLQFPTYQGLSEKVARVANVVKDIALIVLDICAALYHKAVDRPPNLGFEVSTCEMATERAAQHGHTMAVKFFLNRAIINDHSLLKALRYANRFGHLEVVKIILQDIEANKGHLLNGRLCAEFDFAYDHNHFEVAKFFLNEYPILQSHTARIETFLELAGRENDFLKVIFLVENFGKKDDNEPLYKLTGTERALYWAAGHGNFLIVEYLLKHVEISQEDCNEAFVCSAGATNLECFKLLLPRSSPKGRDKALDGILLLGRSSLRQIAAEHPLYNALSVLLPCMPIPDRFLRAAINPSRCRILKFQREEPHDERIVPKSMQTALRKASKLLAFRGHVAKRLADSSKLPLTGKCNFGPKHSNHLIWLERAMPVIMDRIFYGRQDLFKATHLLGEMH